MSTLNVATIKSLNTLPPAVQNSSGTEIGTFCRAWVNFNGTGTVAIRASFNISSITDNGTGDYTVNFSTAMADANYSVNVSKGITATRRTIASYGINGAGSSVTPTTSAVRVICFDESTTTMIDTAGISILIFR